jgi:hypothetical protein
MSRDEPKSLLSTLRSLFRREQPAASETVPRHAPEIAITADNREQWLRFAHEAPLAYGAWADLKRLYKQAERTQDFELLAPLIARLDTAPLPTNPYAPVFGSLLPANTTAISHWQLSGSRAYLIATDYRKSSLHILDYSDPLRPQPIGRLDLNTGAPVALAVEGTRAVLVTRENVVTAHFIDVSDPANPTVAARMALPATVAVAFVGQRLITTSAYHRASALSIIDLTDFRNPTLADKTVIDYTNGLKVVDNIAYVHAYNANRLDLYDIAPGANLRRIGQIQIGNASGYAIHRRLLAITIGYDRQRAAGLYLYDLDRPQQHIGFLALDLAAAVDIKGDYAYVGTRSDTYNRFHKDGLYVIDIKDPARPQLVGQANGGEIKGVTVSDGDVYVCMKHSPNEAEAIRVADVTDPARPILLGRSPDRATLGYMKRRARRLLRAMATQAPDRYIEMAVRVLSQAGAGRKELDPLTQWASMDLLYGGAAHWQQAAHGRSGYHSRAGGLRLRTREERHPELWDRQPEQAAALAANPELPWQIHEAVVKMLRGLGAELPSLSESVTGRYLESPSSLLIALGARAVAVQIAAGEAVTAELAANTFYKGSGRTRNAVRELLARQERDRKWGGAFAERLLKLAGASGQSGPLSRRQSHAFACLVARFPDRLKRLASPQLTASLYATRRSDLVAWALAAYEQADPNDVDAWLVALEPLPVDLRNTAAERLLPIMRGYSCRPSLLSALAYHTSAWIRAVGWDLIAASATDPANIARLWNGLLEAEEVTDALRSAMESPAALALLDRLSFSREKIEALLPTRPFLLALLPPGALRAMLDVLPVSALPALIAAATDAQWPALRAALLALLREPEHLNSFWQEMWPYQGEGEASSRVARLLDEPELTGTFLRIADILPYLETANPTYGPLLGRWLRANGARFGRDTQELLRIATHMLPDIRDYGLERVRALGMSLPFALRLLESELPPAVAAGQEFIAQLPSGDAREPEAILALCDSPQPSVRAYGCQVLETRWDRLPLDLLLNRLTENPDPAIQAFLAAKLLAGAQRPEQTPVFDRQVLRGRDRARRAKELVKRRLDREPSHDIPLLLEMARSRTPRDAEWALGQLARLALEGIEIEGFTVDAPLSWQKRGGGVR